jgi:hypothetical protein
MRFALGIAAGVVIFGLPTGAATIADAETVIGRSGIERVQSDAGKKSPGSDPQRRAKAAPEGQAHRPPAEDRRNEDDDEDRSGSDGNPAPDALQPPGCVFQKAPLELLV